MAKQVAMRVLSDDELDCVGGAKDPEIVLCKPDSKFSVWGVTFTFGTCADGAKYGSARPS
jgi:hypothetical protein